MAERRKLGVKADRESNRDKRKVAPPLVGQGDERSKNSRSELRPLPPARQLTQRRRRRKTARGRRKFPVATFTRATSRSALRDGTPGDNLSVDIARKARPGRRMNSS